MHVELQYLDILIVSCLSMPQFDIGIPYLAHQHGMMCRVYSWLQCDPRSNWYVLTWLHVWPVTFCFDIGTCIYHYEKCVTYIHDPNMTLTFDLKVKFIGFLKWPRVWGTAFVSFDSHTKFGLWMNHHGTINFYLHHVCLTLTFDPIDFYWQFYFTWICLLFFLHNKFYSHCAFSQHTNMWVARGILMQWVLRWGPQDWKYGPSNTCVVSAYGWSHYSVNGNNKWDRMTSFSLFLTHSRCQEETNIWQFASYTLKSDRKP